MKRASSGEKKAIERGLERLREVVRAQNLKMSSVREAIARAALSYDGHFNVEDLVRVLHSEGVSDAHVATVYRALPVMVDAGLIQPAMVANGRGQVYEATFEREHHDHLRCTICGLVIEYQSETLAALEREIAARYDFELLDRVHELRGRCKKCRQKRQSSADTLRKNARPGR